MWTPEVYDALIGILMALPTAYRPYVRRSLGQRVQEQARRGAMRPPTSVGCGPNLKSMRME